MIPIEAIIDRPGLKPLRLTPSLESLRFSTAAVGGFGAASFDLPGDMGRWKREIPHLSLVRLVLDTETLWEGQVEDPTLRLANDPGAAVQCFGLQRRLDENSVRRVWSKRDLSFQQRSLTVVTPDPAFEVGTGTFLLSDLTKIGIQYVGNGQTSSTAKAQQYLIVADDGLTFTTLVLTREKAGNANLFQQIYSAATDGLYSNHINDATNGTFTDVSVALVSNARFIILAEAVTANFATAVTDYCRFYDMRILGTTLAEDVAGGFYGGTILRDLIALVPDLQIGIIDAGSDYTIRALERAVRSASRSVVEEVAGYYSREWTVWEDGRFDWKTVNKDEPQWLCETASLQGGSELTFSVDGLAETVYVIYANAASQRDSEASASSTSQRNPYNRQGKTKDVLVAPGFPMTTSTSSQLASRFVSDVGDYPAVQGRLVLPALAQVKRANGPSLPALQIRGGDNIVVTDLPKTELLGQGRDGETLFHIVSTDADLSTGLVTLTVEGQTSRMDVLLARLAAATRVLTG
jgi:hypothetical protein